MSAAARQLALLAAGLTLAAGVDRLIATTGPGPVRLQVGARQAPLLAGDWSPPQRAAFPDDVHGSLVADEVRAFYYRVLSERGEIRLPLRSRGERVTLTLRADGGVRSTLRLYAGGRPAGELLIPPGPWQQQHTVLEVKPGQSLELGLALRPAPLVRGDHAEQLWLALDYVEVASQDGFELAPALRLGLAAVPLLILGFGLLIGAGHATALAAAALGSVAGVGACWLAPLPAALAAPRLVPLALLTGLAGFAALLGVGELARGQRAGLAGLVALGTLLHGSLVFFPDHNPPDLDTHAVRTLDLAHTPWTRAGLMRYGSHLPTVSQETAPATDLFGERALVPYSPLPYFGYYAAQRLGLDVGWAMTALTAGVLMLVAPLLWLAARAVWGTAAAWTAALLYSLDLPVWHHLGRAHLPAALGNALGVSALLVLLWRAERLDAPRRVLAAAAVLALGSLGYTSLALLLGLYGVLLYAVLLLDARALPLASRRGLAAAFALGGLLAGSVYYFHYLPGLLAHAPALEAEAPDLFDPYSFLVFHNESRQSMRIWRLGSWWLVGAGLLAMPWALRRARPGARPLLLVWLFSWAALMLLKEPFLFPRLLRWTKEEQFLSPLMDLLLAGAVSALPRPWQRWSAAAVAVAWALRLAVRDFLLHADTLAL